MQKNCITKLHIITEAHYEGYKLLEERKCYTQIKGPYLTLSAAMKECSILTSKCNGVQYVNCSNYEKITKSLFKTNCRSQPKYMQETSCNVLLYAKGNF